MPRHPEYRKKWVAARYTSRMGSTEVCLPPPRPYRRVYKMASEHWSLEALRRGRLKVSRFSDLNDPFELIALNLADKAQRQQVKTFSRAFDSETGLLCFSGNWTSPLLWGHYADSHKGICIGFDLSKDRAHKVHYMNKRLEAKLDQYPSTGGLPAELRDALFKTKSSGWRYEQEYRMIVPLHEAVFDGEMHYFNFCHDLQPAEVIVGTKCPTPVEEIRDMVKWHYPNAVVIQARLAWKFFSVVPLESTIP